MENIETLRQRYFELYCHFFQLERQNSDRGERIKGLLDENLALRLEIIHQKTICKPLKQA